MVVFKRSISDGVGASSGPKGDGADSSGVGISTRKIGGSGGGRRTQQEQAEQKEVSNQRQANLQRAAEARRQYEEQKQQARRTQELEEQTREQTTRTGVYEKGGAAIQETTGKYETLVTLGKQQPGSRLVQRESGEYVLLTSKGVNLRDEATFGKIQENIGLEGGEKYYPTSKETPTGTKYMARITEDLGVSGEDLSGAKYSPSYGLKYSVFLEDTLGGEKPKPAYQKTREAQPREIAEMISKGEIPPTFIGYKGGGARRQEVISTEQQGFKAPEVFPITYTTEEGKEIVTITGKSEGTDYNIYGKPTTGYQINLEETITTKEPKKNIVQLAQESSPIYKVIGGRPSGVEESLKGAIKGGAQIGTEIGLMFVPQKISGVGTPEGREELRKGFEKSYPKELQPLETPSSKLLSGQIPVTQYGPRYDIQASATDIFLLASGVPKIEKAVAIKSINLQSPRSKVAQLEYEYLKEPGKVSGVEKISERTFLISKGTELKPAEVPLTVVKFPKGEKPTVREIVPDTTALSPSEINIQGGLFPQFQKSLEVKKLGPYQYQSIEPSLSARQEYQRGVLGEGIKPIARGRTASVADIMGGKASKLLSAAKESPSVYAQTRAETKFTPPKNPLIPSEPVSQKGLRQYEYGREPISPRVGAGQAARGFTPEETETIKSILKTEARVSEKPKEDFLGSIRTPIFLQAQEAESLAIRYPPGKEIQITELEGRVTQKEANVLKQRVETRTEGKTISEQAERLLQKPSQKSQLKEVQRTQTIPKLILGPVQQARTRTATLQRTAQKQVQRYREVLVPRIPEVPPEKPFIPKIPLFFLSEVRKRRETQAEKLGSTKEFLGNVPLGSIIGTYKRKEVTYGDKRISNLLGYERRGNKPKKRKAKKKEPFGISRKFSL